MRLPSPCNFAAARCGVRCLPALAVMLASTAAFGQTVAVVQTNADQSALLTPQPSLAFVPGTSSTMAINVDDTVRYQTLEGVGASFTDSAAYLVWDDLTPAQQNQLMQDLFSTNGIHLSFLRQPMGATDLALSNYTYDDLPAGETDPNMSAVLDCTRPGLHHSDDQVGAGGESTDQGICAAVVASGVDEDQPIDRRRHAEHANTSLPCRNIS